MTIVDRSRNPAFTPPVGYVGRCSSCGARVTWTGTEWLDDDESRHPHTPPASYDEITKFAIEQHFLSSATMVPVDRKRAALCLRLGKQEGYYDEVAAFIMRLHRHRLDSMTMLQRDWQTKVSRRPQRGRHHDSWSIRERYVRLHNNCEVFEQRPEGHRS